MKYVIISDIHANLDALDAVIKTFPCGGEARIFCAGDTVGYGADPGACIELVSSLVAFNIMGNHDAAVVGLTGIEHFNEAAGAAVLWTRGKIDDRKKDYLKGLPLLWQDDAVTMAHGTLHSPEEFFYLFSCDEAENSFSIMNTRLCFVGHTHMPRVFMKKGGNITLRDIKEGKLTLEPGASYIVNAGSVGQPRDNDPRACYCVYDTDDNSLEFFRVEYNVAAARAKIIEAGLPAVLGERLLYGR